MKEFKLIPKCLLRICLEENCKEPQHFILATFGDKQLKAHILEGECNCDLNEEENYENII